MKAVRYAALLAAAAVASAPIAATRDARRIPFSRLASRWRVGVDFFDRYGLVDSERTVCGLTDSMEVFRRGDLPTDQIHIGVREFYEDTQNHLLSVWPKWTPPFRSLYRVYRLLARRVGQTDLPLGGEMSGDPVASRLVALRGPRHNLRAWIRTYREDPDRPMYVAEYATHSANGVTYMDIAFPMPGGNLTSILVPEPLFAGDSTMGFMLTTFNGRRLDGHAGIWFVTSRQAFRLPLQETIWVWAPGMSGLPNDLAVRAGPETTALSRHELRIFGIRYLVLDYAIARAAESDA